MTSARGACWETHACWGSLWRVCVGCVCVCVQKQRVFPPNVCNKQEEMRNERLDCADACDWCVLAMPCSLARWLCAGINNPCTLLLYRDTTDGLCKTLSLVRAPLGSTLQAPAGWRAGKPHRKSPRKIKVCTIWRLVVSRDAPVSLMPVLFADEACWRCQMTASPHPGWPEREQAALSGPQHRLGGLCLSHSIPFISTAKIPLPPESHLKAAQRREGGRKRERERESERVMTTAQTPVSLNRTLCRENVTAPWIRSKGTKYK